MYTFETQILEFSLGLHRVTGIPQLEARSKSGNLCLPDRDAPRQPKPGERWECRPRIFLARNLLVVELITRVSPDEKKPEVAVKEARPRDWEKWENPSQSKKSRAQKRDDRRRHGPDGAVEYIASA